jgi:DNA-binding NarL/FixJ family response regulator
MLTKHSPAVQVYDNKTSNGARFWSYPKPSNSVMTAKTRVTRVALADDHERVRTGIRNLLERAQDIEVVAEAKDGIEALNIVQTYKPDVLILDMEMPRLSGTEVAERLKQEASPVRIIALSAHEDTQYILGMLDYGASGYIMKEEAPEILLKAIRRVAKGESGWISQRVGEKLENHRKRSSMKKSKTFTQREVEILKNVANELSVKEIADAMEIRESIVERYLEILRMKLEVNSNKQLLEAANKEGLL